MPKELADLPELPPFLDYLWKWFDQLHKARTGSGFGPNPITFTEIKAWESLTRHRLERWEVDVIRAIDEAWLFSRVEKSTTAKPAKAKPRGK